MVGTGQLYVVERLSAREFDVARFAKIYRSRSRPFTGRSPEKACLYQRCEALRHGNSPASEHRDGIRRNSLTAAALRRSVGAGFDTRPYCVLSNRSGGSLWPRVMDPISSLTC